MAALQLTLVTPFSGFCLRRLAHQLLTFLNQIARLPLISLGPIPVCSGVRIGVSDCHAGAEFQCLGMSLS